MRVLLSCDFLLLRWKMSQLRTTWLRHFYRVCPHANVQQLRTRERRKVEHLHVDTHGRTCRSQVASSCNIFRRSNKKKSQLSRALTRGLASAKNVAQSPGG